MDEIGNEINPEGARYISNALRENSTLLYLDISGESLPLFHLDSFCFSYVYLFCCFSSVWMR